MSLDGDFLSTGKEQLGRDLLIGADAIARELNWKTKDGRWNRRRVYHLAEQRALPVHRVKGLGLCALRSSLREHFERLDEHFKNTLDRNERES